MAPAALSLLTVAFPAGRQRDVAMGVWGGLAGLGGTAEVVLGGLLVDTLSWRWVFLVNVPVVALLVALSRVVLTESREQVEGTAPVDWRGGVLGTAGLLAVMLGVIDSGAHGWGSTRVLGELVGRAGVADIASRASSTCVKMRRASASVGAVRAVRGPALVGLRLEGDPVEPVAPCWGIERRTPGPLTSALPRLAHQDPGRRAGHGRHGPTVARGGRSGTMRQAAPPCRTG